MNKKVDNFECNGRCSRCGECCTPMLPLTLDEYHTIKNYIEEHDIKCEEFVQPEGVYVRCPFYNIKERKCNIYEVRPEVCKAFRCSFDKKKVADNIKYFDERADINGNHLNRFVPMDLLFYGNPLLTLIILYKQFNCDSPAKLTSMLWKLGLDRKFFDETGLPNTHDVLEGIRDGKIKMDWSED